MSIGVGTPTRILDLLNAGENRGFKVATLSYGLHSSNSGALKVECLDGIVIDFSHVDQKKRGVLDMKETQKPLMDLLNHPALKHRYGVDENRIELLFF